jgi:predicted RNase H-like nuclease (RuvC/YqgF family)
MSKRKFQNGDYATFKVEYGDFYEGELVEIVSYTGGYYRVKSLDRPNEKVVQTQYVEPRYLALVQHKPTKSLETQLESVKQKISKLEQEADLIQDKIKFLEETGCETFSENEFKVYKTLQLIEENSQLTRLEKAQAIAKLINNK